MFLMTSHSETNKRIIRINCVSTIATSPPFPGKSRMGSGTTAAVPLACFYYIKIIYCRQYTHSTNIDGSIFVNIVHPVY